MEASDTIDLLLGRPGCLVKKIIRDGAGWQKPSDASCVKLAVEAATFRHDRDSEESSLPGFEARSLEFCAGNGEVCDAFELSVCQMRKGERALVACRDATLCKEQQLGLQDVAAEVMFVIELLDFSPAPEVSDLSEDQIIEHAASRKEMGTRLFQTGRLQLAMCRYSKVAELLGYVDNFSPANKAKSRDLRKASHLNMAACQLKLGDFEGTISSCCSVLDEDSWNAKALFRRAQACMALGDPKAAYGDLRRIAEYDANNKDARELLKRAKVEMKQGNRKLDNDDRPIFAKMCDALGKGTIPEPLKIPEPQLRDDLEFSAPKSNSAPQFGDLPRADQDELIGKLFTGGARDQLEKVEKERLDQAFVENKAFWPDSDADND